jgi:hypothetical protein
MKKLLSIAIAAAVSNVAVAETTDDQSIANASECFG